MKIYKYQVQVSTRHVQIEMPAGAVVVDVHMQGGQCFLWAVSGNLPTTSRTFRTVITGEECNLDGYQYIGTCHAVDGYQVVHIFEKE